MENQTNTQKALSMSLHDLGLTPQNGRALCSLIDENNENFERQASMPIRKCKDVHVQCCSCGSRPHECHLVFHRLPKISAWRVLAKWSKYYQKKQLRFGNGSCHIIGFLAPSLKNLLEALIERGLSLEYIHNEVPCARNILAYGRTDSRSLSSSAS
jgi:hypothetical protein